MARYLRFSQESEQAIFGFSKYRKIKFSRATGTTNDNRGDRGGVLKGREAVTDPTINGDAVRLLVADSDATIPGTLTFVDNAVMPEKPALLLLFSSAFHFFVYSFEKCG
jgi:hypothetical protein